LVVVVQEVEKTLTGVVVEVRVVIALHSALQVGEPLLNPH
jgi:hypothetical protein